VVKKRSVKLIVTISLVLGVLTLSGQAPEPNFALAGFATETTGTSGGKGGSTITVTTGTELQSAINAHQKSNQPLIIMVEGIINLENSPGLEKIDVKDVSDLSIIGSVNGAEFDGIGLKLRRASNIIIRNISVHHVSSGEKDCIGIEGPADHIWIDHCELYNEFGDVDGDGDEDSTDKDFYDGLLDVKADAEYITYSWNYLHSSWKTSLVGSSESDTYDRKLSIHHNYYNDCYSRLPLFRGKTGHIFNCYYSNIESTAINSRLNSCIRIEKNYFENVHNPWVSAYSDVLGGVELIDNYLINSPFNYSSSDTFEPYSCEADIPYKYEDVLNTVMDVKELVMQYAGVGKLDEPAEFSVAGDETDLVQQKQDHNNLEFFPNPSRGNGILSFHLEEASPVTISLHDFQGKQIKQFNTGIYNAGYNEITIENQNINPGIYLLQLSTRKNNRQIKMVIEK
jgi:pectate lyase